MMHLKFVYSLFLFTRFRHVILYTIIGLLTSVLEFVVYTILIYMIGFHYLIANVVSVLVSIPVGFFLNRNINFMTKEKTFWRFVMFLVVGVSGILITNTILYLCIEIYCFDKITSKLFSIVSVALFQFLLNKYVTFKPTSQYTTKYFETP